MYSKFYNRLKTYLPKTLFLIIKKIIKKNFKYSIIDKKLSSYLNYKNGFFIEIGANDGVAQSNTIFLEYRLNWKGLLIEPVKKKFQDLKNNRSKENFFFNVACKDFENKEKSIKMYYSDLMTISVNTENDIEDPIEHANKGKKFLEKNDLNYEFLIESCTLNSILDDINAPELIDFFSLDVEGAEISVLKGIDFRKYNFKYILIEIRNFDKINYFLTSKNYTLKEKITKHDYLYKFNKSS